MVKQLDTLHVNKINKSKISVCFSGGTDLDRTVFQAANNCPLSTPVMSYFHKYWDSIVVFIMGNKTSVSDTRYFVNNRKKNRKNDQQSDRECQSLIFTNLPFTTTGSRINEAIITKSKLFVMHIVI